MEVVMTTPTTVTNPGPGVLHVRVLYKPQTHSDDPYTVESKYLSPGESVTYIVHAFQFLKVDEIRAHK